MRKMIAIAAFLGLVLAAAPSRAQTVGKFTVGGVAAISVVNHNFTTGVTSVGTVPSGGIGVGVTYSSAIPVGAAFCIDFQLATSGVPDIFGFSVLGKVSKFVAGPAVDWVNGSPQLILRVGGGLDFLQ